MSFPEKTISCQLRWNDIDLVGHVNHTVYHALSEEIRYELLAEALNKDGSTFVLVRQEMDHLAEVRRWDGPLEITGRIDELGTRSVKLSHEIMRADGTVAAKAVSVLVAFDMATRASRPITDEERRQLGG